MKHLFYLAFFLACFACKPKDDVDSGLYSLKKGSFFIEVVETGELNATQSLNISSPALSWEFGALKINQIIDDGAMVKAGDTLVLFDPSEIHKVALNAKAEMEIAQAELNKLQAEQQSRIEELESNLKINEITCKIAQIQLEQAKYEADVTRREIQLNLEKTQIDLEKVRVEIENQKKIHIEEVLQAKLKIRQLQTRLKESEDALKKLTVTSPGDGIAIIGRNWNTRNKWQVGDQPWSGTPMILLPDLSELKIETEINEVDIAKIKIGQEARVKLDAFSDKSFSGKVLTVATLAKFKDEEKSKIKVFPVEVLLDTVSDELLPGMTVSCRILVDKIDDVLFVPLDAVHKEGPEQFVYLRNSKSFKKQYIKTGLANYDFIIVEDGLEAGDRISLSVPEEELKKQQSNQKKQN
ncbi:MAG: HlyD family efflux transporter periplasmic adaptor subunit [Bacteroidales bacterium]|nr:HlyD family efflux transporter periplasmic adaptor subunit [Bacteroidales bacterium]